MKQRIECARADAIAMMRELFHHAQAEEGLMAGMQEHMDANEAGVELALAVIHRDNYTLSGSGGLLP